MPALQQLEWVGAGGLSRFDPLGWTSNDCVIHTLSAANPSPNPNTTWNTRWNSGKHGPSLLMRACSSSWLPSSLACWSRAAADEPLQTHLSPSVPVKERSRMCAVC